MSGAVFRTGLAGCAVIFLSGCCTGVTTDPRAGGLAGGVCGSATGAYDGRISALQNEKNTLDAAGNRLSASLRESRAQVAGLDREIAAKRRQLADIRRQLDALAARVAAGNDSHALLREIHALAARASQREQAVQAIEKGMRSARNEAVMQEARRRADEVPIEDLIKQLRALQASVEHQRMETVRP